MLKQTIVWTALPNGSDGPLTAGTTLHLSVFASPRLWNDNPTVTKMKLSAFPDFMDWPALMSQATFQVEFDGGPTLNATSENMSLRSDLWQAVFGSNTDVIPYVFEDMTGTEVLSFSTTTIEGVLKGVYQRAAIDSTYGAGSDLPGREVWPADPDVRDIARETKPAPPFKPPPRGEPVVIDEPVKKEEKPWWETCCVGCIMWPIILLRKLLKLLVMLVLLPLWAVGIGGPAGPGGTASSGGSGAAGSNPSPASPKKAAFDQLQDYVKPHSQVSTALPTLTEVEQQYDFHQMVAALGDYPNLLRYMGLVMNLAVTLGGDLPAATATVKVIPNLPLQTATTNYSPQTHYELGDGRFLTQPRPTGPEISDGLLRLHDSSLFQVTQVDVAGGGIKLQNMATNLVALEDQQAWPPNSPEEAGLPSLQTAGISIVRPEQGLELQQSFVQAYALNLALAAVDGSPAPPPASGDPPPSPTDELWAEDVVRGYRMDVFDDQSMAWHSLCRRIGTYTFLDAPGGALTLSDEEDEGFVQMGVTEPLSATGTRVLRAHESLLTWDGWSLCASRPGKTILPDDTVGDPPNTAVTQFHMEAEFRAKPKSLPRLRFGYGYRLRARAVDLAGNSVFGPDDAEFGNTPTEVTTEFEFQRFEPVSPPPLFLRAELKEGDSLERMVVRSKFDDAPADIHIQETERHVVPPKTSQLMAERHGQFDGTPGMLKDQAAYDLASREASSLTQKLNLVSGDLEDIDGIQEITTPERTYYLQTKEQFEVAYLPDPFARGVLFLGLPGMASFEEIIEPDGVKVNKIPFDGPWPDYKALRLRLVGLEEGVAPPKPSWDAPNRLLTVHLPQGETARVRISSYFHTEDLEKQALWQWTQEAGPPNLVELRDKAVAGRNWLYLPFRELVLVHAVQQPLKIPQIAQLQIQPDKVLDSTTVTLNGNVDVDAKSTGKVDIRAAWQDPFDNPSKPTFDPLVDVVSKEQRIDEVLVEDPENDVATVKDMQHALGDTKYHRVSYTPVATTRFREYFPPAVTADPHNLIRPTPSEAGIAFELDVPNSARPDVPKPLYVVPTFAWSRTDVGDLITKVRRGGGLRVYLERPWFSSGAGELLGVLIRPASIPVGSELAQKVRKYTSEWGMDPLWPAESTAPLTTGDFQNAATLGQQLLLAELPNVRVDAVGYEPGYDTDRNLWYCDAKIDPGTAYFPFVRMALARFHPISVPGAHLSRVVLADFTQVVPHRTVTYDLGQVAVGATLQVKVSGPSYFYPQLETQGTTIMVAGLQQRQFAEMEDELGWTALAGQFLTLTSPGPAETIWEGTIAVPQPQPHPLRVVILELEGYLADQTWTPVEFMRMAESGELEDTVPMTGTLVDKPVRGFRIVFADAVELP